MGASSSLAVCKVTCTGAIYFKKLHEFNYGQFRRLCMRKITNLEGRSRVNHHYNDNIVGECKWPLLWKWFHSKILLRASITKHVHLFIYFNEILFVVQNRKVGKLIPLLTHRWRRKKSLSLSLYDRASKNSQRQTQEESCVSATFLFLLVRTHTHARLIKNKIEAILRFISNQNRKKKTKQNEKQENSKET